MTLLISSNPIFRWDRDAISDPNVIDSSRRVYVCSEASSAEFERQFMYGKGDKVYHAKPEPIVVPKNPTPSSSSSSSSDWFGSMDLNSVAASIWSSSNNIGRMLGLIDDEAVSALTGNYS